MKNSLFEEELKKDLNWFTKNFRKTLEAYLKNFPQRYKKMIFYFLFPGGKYIRPILMFCSSKMLGIKKEDVFYPACCIELIHNYSLIHDDLPCMDNDDYRRGRLSLHKKFSESDAILIGDGLLTLAFEILSDWQNMKHDIILKVLKLISNYVGFDGLIKGQFMDLEGKKFFYVKKDKKYIKKYLEDLSINKTAKLIEASIIVPAIVSNLDSKKMNVLRNIAQKIGLLFQITDDLIDFLNGQDKDNLNYPLIFGVDKTKQLIENFKTEIIKDIQKNFPFRNEFLRYVVEKISYREK